MKSFEQLWTELSDKVEKNDSNSASVKLVNQGVHAVGKKVVEEASEAWMACEHEDKNRAAEEISQLIYQTQLLMLAANVSLDDVYKKL
ncbi:MAG: phosphoribosyl-ATP diphosphatase [Actinomycetes bacterium]|uniref:phosphoribosyl-ATP diphosphatase n=1 Tax=freshwater metagenome TaxID=449393 RepID=A0A6J6EDA4_9ZZZZ|nr:phosphoribosyl-ATP diphosphatase [Actinomycetota bacterium]